jgi:hypothetical protein
VPPAARAVAAATLLAARRALLGLPEELWALVLSMATAALWRTGPHRVGVEFRWQRRLGGRRGVADETGTTTVWARPCRSWAWITAALRRASGPAFIRGIELVGFPYQSRRYSNGARRVLDDGHWRDVDVDWPRGASAVAPASEWFVGDSLRPLTAAETEAAHFVMAEIEVAPDTYKLVDLARTMRPDLIVPKLKQLLPAWLRAFKLIVAHDGTAVDRCTAIGDTGLVDGGPLDLWAMAAPGTLPLRPGARATRTNVGYDVDVANIVDLAPP